MKPGFKQTEVGVIPEDWDGVQLSELLSFISYGFTNPMPTTSSGPIMVTAADISNGRIAVETARSTSQDAFDRLLTGKSKPKAHDILLTKDGTLGRVALVDSEIICINQSVAILRPNRKVEPKFLALLLQADKYQKRMLEDAGGSTIKHIYITIVDKMPIAVPSDIAEQRAIAAALSDVDAAVAGLERLIAKKRDLKQAAMQHLLTGQTRLPGFSGEWEVKQLGEVGDAIIGLTYRPEDVRASGALVLRSSNVQGGALSFDDNVFVEKEIPQHLMVRPNDVLICVRNGSRELIGKSALLDERTEGMTFGAFMTVFRSDIGKLVNYLFQSNTLRKQVQDQLGATINQITNASMKSFSVPLAPTRAEQDAIATVLSDIDAELSALQSRLDKTRLIKQAMMQELLTGRTRLPLPMSDG